MLTYDASKPDAVKRYVDALMALLGDRDPLQVQANLIPALRAEMAGLSVAALRQPEANGKWSILEVLQHLVDAEWVYGYRFRVIVGEDNPPILGYDQNAWVERLKYNEADPDVALAHLKALRDMNLHWFHARTASDWARTGEHSERGPESLRHLLHLMAAHDLVHLRQIKRIKAVVQG